MSICFFFFLKNFVEGMEGGNPGVLCLVKTAKLAQLLQSEAGHIRETWVSGMGVYAAADLVPPPQGCPTFWHLWATLEEEELSWATH